MIPSDNVAKVLDCGLKVSEFKLLPGKYVHFWSLNPEEKV